MRKKETRLDKIIANGYYLSTGKLIIICALCDGANDLRFLVQEKLSVTTLCKRCLNTVLREMDDEREG